MTLQEYISVVNQRYQAGNATEHTYRGDLQQLLQSLLIHADITNEPKRIECGAPDYIISHKGKDIPIGYIEAKDIGVDLNSKVHKTQLDRYRSALDNLIVTDYLQFHFYKEGYLEESVYIGEVINGKVCSKADSFDHFRALILNFGTAITQSIKSPTKLAVMMASKARLMANVIYSALEEDDCKEAMTELQNQREAFRSVLIHDIDNHQFSDIYAQTIAYGLFAARYHDPTLPTFSREEAARLIPHSNPFLRKLFQTVATYSLEDNIGQRVLWIVEELVQVFLATDVAKIMKNFGRLTHQQDPVVHFYETFLAKYDPSLRKSRGVWYTPEPVVNFIVRGVDDILKNTFNLEQGLANTSTTKIKIKTDKFDKRTTSGYVESEKIVHKVQILDPATGTGTFLAKTIEHIYQNHFQNLQGMWPAYVRDHLIPRLNGFEILMTSYAMAHLKMDMLLSETGYKTEEATDRLRIYLTNSLEEHHPDTGTLFASWLSSEANEANHIKRDAPVMVVIGNPPYSGESSNKGEWIMNLMDDYKKEPGGKHKLKERNPKWINNDYVKFIRFSEHFIEKNGEGVIAFINPNSFLDNPTFRGVRWRLLKTFDEIYTLDLHGYTKKGESSPNQVVDQNIFDITQGVSINFFIKKSEKNDRDLARVFHAEIYGSRADKYEYLNVNRINSIQWKEVLYSTPQYYFVPKNFELKEAYDKFLGITDIFENNSVGVVTANDAVLINSSTSELLKAVSKFYDQQASETFITEIAYRVFDKRYIYYDTAKIARARTKIMSNYISYNLGLICKKGGIEELSAPIFITNSISEFRYWSRSGMQGGDYTFPLYIYNTNTDILNNSNRHPNLNPQSMKRIEKSLGLKFSNEEIDNENTFSPIDLLDYIYAILHSPKFIETYKEFLKIDFPRIPVPNNAVEFKKLIVLGAKIRKLHLLEFSLEESEVTYPIPGNNIVEKLRYEEDKVFINTSQYFEGVTSKVWNSFIGGYQPAQKWIKDRKGSELNYSDIQHYQKIIYTLEKTHELMSEIAKVNTFANGHEH